MTTATAAIAAIASHLNVAASAIVEIQEWARVLWVRIKGVGARFVSKKVVEAMTMTIEQAMTLASSQAGTHGIFYRPSTMEAVIAPHGQEPQGFILWCDCSVAARMIEVYGIELAYQKIAR